MRGNSKKGFWYYWPFIVFLTVLLVSYRFGDSMVGCILFAIDIVFLILVVFVKTTGGFLGRVIFWVTAMLIAVITILAANSWINNLIYNVSLVR